tara:strand:+ start:10998 stop:11726 length:729 start_codon:yes stop_codon:yes gene_type:complete
MKFLFNLILKIIDFFYHKKIINFFKENTNLKYNVLIDVGAHKGETVVNFLKNFKIKNVYSFEASNKTYKDLKINMYKIQKMYPETNIEIINQGVGNSNDLKLFNESPDSNSSTFNSIDENSSYFKRKNKIISFFIKEKKIINKQMVSQIKLGEFIIKKNIKNVDILKIDTEGYELEVLKSLEQTIQNINFIYFEHHYDNMIIKNYTFSDIHDLLIKADFSRVFKIRMPMRKSFDYIYKKNTI